MQSIYIERSRSWFLRYPTFLRRPLGHPKNRQVPGLSCKASSRISASDSPQAPVGPRLAIPGPFEWSKYSPWIAQWLKKHSKCDSSMDIHGVQILGQSHLRFRISSRSRARHPGWQVGILRPGLNGVTPKKDKFVAGMKRLYKLIQIEHFRTLGASDSRVDIVYKFYCPFDAARPTRAWAVRGAQPKNWGRETLDCSHLFTPFRQLLAQVETNLWPTVEYDNPQDIGLGRFWYYKPRTKSPAQHGFWANHWPGPRWSCWWVCSQPLFLHKSFVSSHGKPWQGFP